MTIRRKLIEYNLPLAEIPIQNQAAHFRDQSILTPVV